MKRLLAIGALISVVSLSACSSSTRSGNGPGSTATSSSVVGTTTTTSTTTATSSTTAAVPTSVPRPAGLGSYMPLFPFPDAAAVSAWQTSFRTGGHQPWHLDAGETAVAFAAYLGYSNVDKALRATTDGTGTHVAVGFSSGGSGSPTVTSAIVHLVRWGTGPDIPWEVVGTDDVTFTLTVPRYGATVHSPLTVGGSITGVDESIKVQVRSLGSSSTLGAYCCVAAGGTGSPWRADVSVAAPAATVVTVAASTGGHLAAVERFAVTGVTVR